MVGNEHIRAICDQCRTYKDNICHLCAEALRNFTVANIKYNIKDVGDNFESPKQSPLQDKNFNQPSTPKWRSIFPLKEQLFISESLQLKPSPSLYEENKKISLECVENFDINSSVWKREDISPTDIKNKIPKILQPNKSYSIIKEFTDNKEFKARKNQIYSKKSLPNLLSEAKAVPLPETKPLVVKEKEPLTEKSNEICDMHFLGTLPKPHYNPLQIAAVSNTRQLANSMKKNKTVTFQKCTPNTERLPVTQSGILPQLKNETMVSSAKSMLISKTKSYVGNKRIPDIRKFDEKNNLQIYKSLHYLQETPRPPSITHYIALVLVELQVVAYSKLDLNLCFESATVFLLIRNIDR